MQKRSKIAQSLLGFSEKEVREYDFPSVQSKTGVFSHKGVSIRQNVRIAAGMIMGPADLNKERKKAEDFIPHDLRSKK